MKKAVGHLLPYIEEAKNNAGGVAGRGLPPLPKRLLQCPMPMRSGGMPSCGKKWCIVMVPYSKLEWVMSTA